MLYIVRTGIQWRNLPSYIPNWQAVYYYSDKWKSSGVLEHINCITNQMHRKEVGKNENPSMFCIDSQNVKLSTKVLKIAESMLIKK